MKELFKRIPKQTGSSENKHGTNNANGAEEENAPMFAWSATAAKPENEKTANKHDIPDDLWIKCPKCNELIYTKEFEHNKKVCSKCSYHFRLTSRERISLLLDEGSFEEMDGGLIAADPLGFVSVAEPPYQLKAELTRKKSGVNEAIITGTGLIEAQPIAVAVCDFAYQGGSMGGVFGEKFARVVEKAIELRIPVLTVSASGGARMHEGLYSLMQMAKTTGALAKLGEYQLPHFSMLTGPTLGGVTASYASVADVIMAEPGAVIGFAGQRVIEQTTRQKLPPGFQTAEFLLEHGLIDLIVPRRELQTVLSNLLKVYNIAYLQNTRLQDLARQAQDQAREVVYAQ